MIRELANPTRFMSLSGALLPWVGGLAALLMAVGLYMVWFTAPADYQQGETVKIMYIHVPAAWLSLFFYMIMASSALGTPGLAPSAGGRVAEGRRPHRRRLHPDLPRHRLALGQAHVGHLLAMGCAGSPPCW